MSGGQVAGIVAGTGTGVEGEGEHTHYTRHSASKSDTADGQHCSRRDSTPHVARTAVGHTLSGADMWVDQGLARAGGMPDAEVVEGSKTNCLLNTGTSDFLLDGTTAGMSNDPMVVGTGTAAPRSMVLESAHA